MNRYGSHRRLMGNAKAAILAAIEIYNKPQIAYRDECFSILLINAWELLLKAVLSKNKQLIFYPKKRNEPYRTLSMSHAFERCQPYFPQSILFEPTRRNLNALEDYRDKAVHFYNEKGINILIFGLAQTSIVNFRDLLFETFGVDLSHDISLALLPLALGPRPDPIQFLQNAKNKPPRNSIAAGYLESVFQATQDLENQRLDTARFLTTFIVSFQSLKKIAAADIIAGVSADHALPPGALVVQRKSDPNITHPLRQREVLNEIGDKLQGEKFSSYVFQAILWKYAIKSNDNLCWTSKLGNTSQYSREILVFLRKLTAQEIQVAKSGYSNYTSQTPARRKTNR